MPLWVESPARPPNHGEGDCLVEVQKCPCPPAPGTLRHTGACLGTVSALGSLSLRRRNALMRPMCRERTGLSIHTLQNGSLSDSFLVARKYYNK